MKRRVQTRAVSGLSRSSYSPGNGFLKLMRSHETEALLRDPCAFALLALIALRARWRSRFDPDDLEIGEARIGDHANCGMTRQQYRTRLTRLESWGFIRVRKTNRGTIAKLLTRDVFDVNANAETHQPLEQPTESPEKTETPQPTDQPRDSHPSTNRQPLTKKERTKESAVGVQNTRTRRTVRRLCEHIAATATSDSDFVEKLRDVFPKNRVRFEYGRFLDYCKQHRHTATKEGFVSWMLRARPEAKPLPSLSRERQQEGLAAPRVAQEAEREADRQMAEHASKLRAFRKGLRDPARRAATGTIINE